MPWYRIVHFSIMVLGGMTGIIHFAKLTPGSRWVLVLLILTCATEMVAWVLSVWGNGNYIIYHFFIVIQFILLCQAFWDELKQLRVLIQIEQWVMVAAGLINLFVYNGQLNDVYPSFLRTLFNVLVIVTCLAYLRELLNSQTDYSFKQYPLFWLSLGWLLFSIITLFDFSAFNYLITSAQKAELLFKAIRIAANFMLYTMFVFALLSDQRRIGDATVYGT